MNKILILYSKESEKQDLMEIFSDFVELGVLLFFTDSKEKAFEIARKENPKLILVDSDQAPFEGVNSPLLFIQEKKEKGEGIVKPLHKHQVLEKCMPFLDQTNLRMKEELPM